MDEAVKKWFMDTAATKWKDRKTRLKQKYFDETLTDVQMKEKLKNILNVADMNELIEFWRSPEFQVSNNHMNLSFPLLAYECANLNDLCHRLAVKEEKQIVQS